MHPKISRTFKGLSGNAGTFWTGFVLLLAALVLGSAPAPAFAQAPATPAPSTVESQVRKFGVGKSVKFTLVDGEQLSGHIKAIGPDSFTVKLSKPKSEKSIPYAQVTEIKDPGPLFWIVVGAAIVIVVIVIFHH